MKKHWSVDTRELEKEAEKLAIWRLEQAINWGIGASRLNKADLIKYWDRIDIDAWKRKALSLALY